MFRYTTFLSVLIALFMAADTSGQSLTTIAGIGYEGYYGDGAPALSGYLHWPQGVAIDNSGNLYIADAQNNVIRMVNSSGIITTIAGSGFEAGTGSGGYSGDGGPATAAHLWGPSGVAIDKNGYIYIADHDNNRVRKIDTAAGHHISTVAGNGSIGFSGDGAAATLAQLSFPSRVTVDTFGNLFIADTGNNCIRRVDNASGNITTVAGIGAVAGYSGDGGPAISATLNHPVDVAVDVYGNLFIVDMYNEVIRKVDLTGNISTISGNGFPGFNGDGGPASAAQFYFPAGIAIDTAGNIYIADLGNQRLRKINKADTITTLAGNGTGGFNGDNHAATAAELWFPNGIAVNAFGNVCIADQGNNRIRLMSVTLGAPTVNNVAKDFVLFPNPTEGKFTVNIPSSLDEEAILIITNISGNIIGQYTFPANKPNELYIYAPLGIYFISAKTSQGNWNKKLVVQ